MTKPAALLLFNASEFLTAAIGKRLELVSLAGMTRQQGEHWLAREGHRVRVVVTTGKMGCDNALLERLPNVGLIAVHGVGHDRVDLAYCAARGIGVSNTPGALTEDVADLAVGLAISLLRRIPFADSYVRAGSWRQGEVPLATRVSGKRFGIFGLGRIGTAIAERVSAFGPVSYATHSVKNVPWQHYPGVLSLARASDVLIVACAANPQTRGLVDGAVLSALGEGGFLVNIARGDVVDQPALEHALETHRIGGAALDVFVDEPEVAAGLRLSERTVLTPHMASATVEAREAMAQMVFANVDAFLAGAELPNSVSR